MKKLLISTPFILFLAVASHAQIEGGIKDRLEKSIPGVLLTASDSTGKLADTASSDQRGFYAFKKLRIGMYKIEVTAAGYKTIMYENIIVNNEIAAGDTKRNDISGATRLDIILTKN